MEHPESIRLYSQYDRDLLRKPKPVLDEDEEPPAEEEDEEANKPVDEKDLVFRPSESACSLQSSLKAYEC